MSHHPSIKRVMQDCQVWMDHVVVQHVIFGYSGVTEKGKKMVNLKINLKQTL